MGVTLGSYDSKNDWNLDFLGYSIEAPSPKVNKVSIPLRDGEIDMTEVLGGGIRYQNRTIKMRFEIRDQRANWRTKMSTIMTAIHGQIIDVQLPDDTTHYWHGRCEIGELKDNTATATVEISLNATPFRYGTTYTTYGPITVDGDPETQTITVTSSRAYLAFEVTGSITVTFDSDQFGFDDAYTFVAGIYVDSNIAYTFGPIAVGYTLKSIPGLVLFKGTNTLTFTGNGTVKIYTTEGSL